MLGHKSILPHFVSYLILVLFFLVLSVSVDAPTANGSAVAPNATAPREEPARSPVDQPSSPDAKGERANALGDLAPPEEKPASLKSDPTKAAPVVPTAPPPPQPVQCTPNNTINADVVAIPQPIMLNRLGAAIPDGLIFVLRADTKDVNHWLQLLPGKRPRPLVLRANVGDCLNITFTNSVPPSNFTTTKEAPSTGTTEVSLHVQGMEWTSSTTDDASFVGVNPSSLASPGVTQHYKLFVKHEGTFLLYT